MKTFAIRCSALACAAVFCAACGAEPGLTGDEPDAAGLGQIEEAFTATQPSVRPTIYDFTSAQRQTLANGILAFITQSILDEHTNGHDWHHPSVGELFFTRHHDYLKKLETYLLNNGLSQFVPVPEWNPGTAIPSQFLVADPLVTQSPMTQNPNRPPPAEFADTELCKFATTSAGRSGRKLARRRARGRRRGHGLDQYGARRTDLLAVARLLGRHVSRAHLAL